MRFVLSINNAFHRLFTQSGSRMQAFFTAFKKPLTTLFILGSDPKQRGVAEQRYRQHGLRPVPLVRFKQTGGAFITAGPEAKRFRACRLRRIKTSETLTEEEAS
jgi:hypothetical protein